MGLTKDISIDELVAGSPYLLPPEDKGPILLELLQKQIKSASDRHAGYRNLVENSPLCVSNAKSVSDLPFLSVRAFKTVEPISLVGKDEIKRVMASSATTGQTPSRIALDAITSRRMSRGVSSIISNYIGKERRPYLVVDVPESSQAVEGSMGARGAAIRGLQPFAKSMTFCLRTKPNGELALDQDVVDRFCDDNRDEPVLIYGFTYLLWLHFVMPLKEMARKLPLKKAHVLHSGGWKRLTDRAVDKSIFNRDIAEVIGVEVSRVLDFYGMVENLGIVYPDCPEGNKHVPVFGDIVVRSPLTLEPVSEGETGLIQTCSVLPESFPGHLLLTEDLATIICEDGCPCGRRGVAFRFEGRVARAEVRGCGNVQAKR